MNMKTLLAATALSLFATGALAECTYQSDTPVKSLSAGFEAWKSVTDAMAECGTVEAELDQEFRQKQPQAFAADPSLYHLGGVANGTITPLLNENLIRPLDEYVEKYGQSLSPNQLIRMDGNIMAIAMMVNTQHLMYRKDIFEDLGLEVPTTYDELLAAAAAIQEAGVVDYPVGATMKSGWNIAQEFVNMFAGHAGNMFNDDSTPNLNTPEGVAALEKMKALTEFMDPEYLTSDSTYVQQQFQQGKIAMANLWASRGGAMDDPNESQVVGKVFGASAPKISTDGPPATTLWWDGFVVAANVPDEEAENAFRIALEGMDTAMVEANQDDAIWLISGYQPNRLAEGAIATAISDPVPPSYPSTTEMGLMHTVLGNELPSFFTGDRSAEDTLAAIEAAYITSAKEAGVLE
ncbi:MAG: extracellular solute-binding protein [Pseudomonadota bacterium]